MSKIGRAAITAQGIGEIFLAQAAVLFLVAMTYLTLLVLSGGARWSWSLRSDGHLNQTADRCVGWVGRDELDVVFSRTEL